MTDLSVIQSWPRAQLEDAFSQVEDELAKALEAEKLAHAGFDNAAAERDQLKQGVESLEKQLSIASQLLCQVRLYQFTGYMEWQNSRDEFLTNLQK